MMKYFMSIWWLITGLSLGIAFIVGVSANIVIAIITVSVGVLLGFVFWPDE